MELKIKTEINKEVLSREVVISNQDEYLQAGDVLKLCKNKVKQLDDERKTYTAPLDASKKLIMSKFKEVIDPLKEYIAKVDEKMIEYHIIEQKKIEKEQEELDKKAIEEAGDNPDVEVEVLPDAPKTTRGDIATTTMKEKWDFEIKDDKDVPREFLMVDDVAIRSAIRSGTREIKGVYIFKTYSTNSR